MGGGLSGSLARVGTAKTPCLVAVHHSCLPNCGNATSPTSGTLIAVVTAEPIELPVGVKTRKIEVIPREQATEVFLPAIAAALDAPADTGADTATRAIDWSVATLRYEIVKH